MRKNALTRLIVNIILTILTICLAAFSVYIIKDFLWGTVEGWDGLAGLVVFPLAIIACGIIIILTIFNITSLIFCLDSLQKNQDDFKKRKIDLFASIVSVFGIGLAVIHIIFMFIEIIIKR